MRSGAASARNGPSRLVSRDTVGGADAGNTTARTLSKQRTLAFFKQHL